MTTPGSTRRREERRRPDGVSGFLHSLTNRRQRHRRRPSGPATDGAVCPRCSGTGVIPDDKVIGAAWRTRRVAAGLSLRAVAARVHLSAAYLSDLETGRRHWSRKNIERYESVLG